MKPEVESPKPIELYSIAKQKMNAKLFLLSMAAASAALLGCDSGSLLLPENEFLINASTPFDTSSISLNWEREDTFYFVVVENLEATPTPINQPPFPGGSRGQSRSFRSRPIRESNYSIRSLDLTYLGEHRVKVYKVNQEYANLYAFGLQDSRNLNEPETNIKNGLGVFTGFSSEEVRFRVVKQ